LHGLLPRFSRAIAQLFKNHTFLMVQLHGLTYYSKMGGKPNKDTVSVKIIKF